MTIPSNGNKTDKLPEVTSTYTPDSIECASSKYNITLRALSSRHAHFITPGGAIGTGLFVSTGATLAKGGPAFLVGSYVLMSALVYLDPNGRHGDIRLPLPAERCITTVVDMYRATLSVQCVYGLLSITVSVADFLSACISQELVVHCWQFGCVLITLQSHLSRTLGNISRTLLLDIGVVAQLIRATSSDHNSEL
jgi:L-asparagine transporter-like permease